MNRILLISLSLTCLASFAQETKKISILDNISHIEPEIYYKIDSVPRQCNVLNMKEQYINVGDCKLYCEYQGNGIPMVLINGGPGGTHHCFHPKFAKAEKFCRVIYYDQRGCGLSDFIAGDNGYTFDQAVDDLDKLRKELGISQWIVCGYSYGGSLAQFYALKYPEHTYAMVLIGSSPMFKNEEFDKTRQFEFISEEEKIRMREIRKLHNDNKLNLSEYIYNAQLNGDWKRQSFYIPTKEQAAQIAQYEWVNDSGFNRQVNLSKSYYNFKNAFDHTPIPTLICEGKHDLTWGENKAKVLKMNHPKAEMVVFKMAGHEVFNEDPATFFNVLEKFVKKTKPATSKQIERWKIEVEKIMNPQYEMIETERAFFQMIQSETEENILKYYRKTTNKNKQLFTEYGMNQLGRSYMDKEDYSKAILIFEVNAEAFPESLSTYKNLGNAYLQKGDKPSAKENYEKVLGLDSENKDIKKKLEDIEE